jgi:hypothetical protein
MDTYKLNNQICEVKDACGRGQEIRFIDFQSTVKCAKQNCTFTRWYQSKTVTSSLTSMHKGWSEEYESCHLFNKGLFFMMGNVLVRYYDMASVTINDTDTPEDKRRKLLIQRSFSRQYPEYTHPDTLSSSAQITAKQTLWIRRYCNPKWIEYYMSKCLRVGSIVEMEMNEALSRAHGVARSGHTENHNAYNYYAQVPFSIVATGGRALAGWSHPKEPEVIPTFSSLSTENMNLMKHFSLTKLFGKISVAEFMVPSSASPKNVGRLLPFLVEISATMLSGIHRFEAYHWVHEYKERAVFSGIFEHLWEHKINPSFMDKMSWMHVYLVEQSKIVHNAWVKERNLRDACCDNTKGHHSTMGPASLAMMFSDLASNQQHLATSLRQQQARNNQLVSQMGRMLQLLESGHGMNPIQSTLVSEVSVATPVPMQEATIKEPAAASLVANGSESTPRALDSWLVPTRQTSSPAVGTSCVTERETDVNKVLSWSNEKKRSPPQDVKTGDGKRQLSAPTLSKIIIDLWKRGALTGWDKPHMHRLCKGPFTGVVGYRDNENAKLVSTARAFELVISESEKEWLKKAFANAAEPGTYEKTIQFLALVDKRILVLALWPKSKKYSDSHSVSYVALSQRLGKDWHGKIKLPPGEESWLKMLSRKYPEAYLKVDQMLA